MEFWPKRKSEFNGQKPLVTEGFTEEEVAQYPRGLDGIDSPESFIQSIDFDILNDIFDSLTAKSEGSEVARTTSHRIGVDSVSFKNELSSGEHSISGSANVTTGEIQLRWEERDDNAPRPVVQTINTLKTLAHEATHIRGGYHDEDWVEETDEGEKIHGFTIRRGVREATNSTNRKGTRNIGLSLNEAITENIAHEVVNEYLIRTGNSGYLKDKEVVHDIGGGSYINDRLLLNVVINSLARDCGVPRDEVWKGFVQAYMSGNVDLQALLRDMETAIRSEPRVSELVWLLGSSTSLDVSDALSLEEILSRVKSNTEAIDVLGRVLKAVDKNKFENVLGLR